MWKEYYIADTIDSVVDFIGENSPHKKIIAGATDLMLEIRNGQRPGVTHVIDVSHIPGHDQIKLDSNNNLHIGFNTTHTDCTSSELIRTNAALLGLASLGVGSPAIRNVGTIVGNLITASPANDTITPLMALDANLVLRSINGTRTIPVNNFYSGVRRTDLREDEFLTEIIFPALKDNQRGIFLKYSLRKDLAISISNLAVILTFIGPVVDSAKITMGAVAPTVIHASEAEEYLRGKALTFEVIEKAASLAEKAARPISDIRGTADFRRKTISVLVRNALKVLTNEPAANMIPTPNHKIRRVKTALPQKESGAFCGTIKTTINERSYSLDNCSNKTLSQLIRDDVGLTGTKEGCSEGECGACTVILNNKPVLSCILPAPRAHQAQITTIEGIGTPDKLSPVQQKFIEHGALQCGFCTPGFIISASSLLQETPEPTMEEIKQGISGNLCRCTGYVNIIKAIESAIQADGSAGIPVLTPDEDHVQSTQLQKDAVAKVTGTIKYGADITHPDMLFGKILWSKYPRANIKNIDVSQAEMIIGVERIITEKDIPGLNQKGYLFRDEPAISSDHVNQLGDSLAVVFAISESVAETAINLINVEYEQLPTISTPQAAAKEKAIAIHKDGNLCHHVRIDRGDVETAFTSCKYVVEREYKTQRIDHAFLEPESGVAYPNEVGGITLETGTQGIFETRSQLSEILGLPEEKVRVIHIPQGGCFGGKLDMIIEHYLALGAYLTKKPVRIVLSRRESLQSHVKRHPTWMRYKTGVDENGKVLALKAEIIADTGAYHSVGLDVLENMAVFGAGPYYIPNVYIDGKAWFTNNIYSGSMRGFGVNQVAFALEQNMDEMARLVDMDPLDFRTHNALDEGLPTAADHVMEKGVVSIKETIAGAKRVMQELKTPQSTASRKIGIGVASAVKNVGFGHHVPEEAGTTIKMDSQGNVTVYVTHHEYGQGAHAAHAQLVANELGIPVNRISVTGPDTNKTYPTHSTTASSQTYLSGNSTVLASRDLKQNIMGKAADVMGIDPGKLKFSGEMIIDDESKQGIKIAEIGEEFIIQKIFHAPLTSELREVWQKSNYGEEGFTSRKTHFAYSFSTQIAVVKVDTETGHVQVLHVVSVNDVGKAINPKVIEGQIHGGVMQGIGYALTEDLILENCYNMTDSLSKYLIPTVEFTPEITPVLIEVPHPQGPEGAKGFAEAPSLATAPAIINAIYDATGIRISRLPATPERILSALEEVKDE